METLLLAILYPGFWKPLSWVFSLLLCPFLHCLHNQLPLLFFYFLIFFLLLFLKCPVLVRFFCISFEFYVLCIVSAWFFILFVLASVFYIGGFLQISVQILGSPFILTDPPDVMSVLHWHGISSPSAPSLSVQSLCWRLKRLTFPVFLSRVGGGGDLPKIWVAGSEHIPVLRLDDLTGLPFRKGVTSTLQQGHPCQNQHQHGRKVLPQKYLIVLI